MAMPPGPPEAEQPQMSPEEAQQVLAKFGIKPDDIPMVMAACEALEPQGEEEAQPPAPKPSLMSALGQRFQG